jgi:predicted esterase
MSCRRNHFDALRRCQWTLQLLALLASIPSVHGQQFQYIDKIVVEEPTELDWVYSHLGTSPPAAQIDVAQMTGRGGDFTYEFYGPAGDVRVGAPLVIFVSPQDRPVGWDFWAETCESHGVMFAGIRDAGNGVAEARRIRAVLEVLSDVRRRHGGRPGQTYLAGFSGGAHVAWRVACALPEHFGGVACIGYAPQPPRSAWQRVRLAERLSVAIINGDRDPAAPWVESLYGPLFEEYGVRTLSEVLARHGHEMPSSEVMEEAFNWLELETDARAQDSKRWLELRPAGKTSREEASATALSFAKQRLIQPESIPAGLAALAGIVDRWLDTPAADEARTLLSEYEQRANKPWLADQQRQELKLLHIEADGYEQLARSSEPPLRSQRAALAANSKHRWEQLAQQGDERQQAEATQRLEELEKRLARLPTSEAKTAAVPMAKVRFELMGEVTLAEGIGHFERILAKLGYRLKIDPTAEPVIAASGNSKIKLELPAAPYSEVDRRFFRRHGLKLVRKGTEVKVLPQEARADAAPK